MSKDKETDVFEKMRHSCIYGFLSYDENHIADWTCHNRDNPSFEDSWGKCGMHTCPLLGGEMKR